LGFWDELGRLGGSTADFAQAYVIAHELGHHVQNLLGIESRVRHLEGQEPSQRNHLSVDLELQADCFAGVWAHSTEQRNIVHEADINAGLKAAAAVGDDHIQKMTRGTISPESFTHGTSAQRQMWFRRGLEDGTVSSCNTFKTGGAVPDEGSRELAPPLISPEMPLPGGVHGRKSNLCNDLRFNVLPNSSNQRSYG